MPLLSRCSRRLMAPCCAIPSWCCRTAWTPGRPCDACADARGKRDVRGRAPYRGRRVGDLVLRGKLGGDALRGPLAHRRALEQATRATRGPRGRGRRFAWPTTSGRATTRRAARLPSCRIVSAYRAGHVAAGARERGDVPRLRHRALRVGLRVDGRERGARDWTSSRRAEDKGKDDEASAGHLQGGAGASGLGILGALDSVAAPKKASPWGMRRRASLRRLRPLRATSSFPGRAGWKRRSANPRPRRRGSLAQSAAGADVGAPPGQPAPFGGHRPTVALAGGCEGSGFAPRRSLPTIAPAVDVAKVEAARVALQGSPDLVSDTPTSRSCWCARATWTTSRRVAYSLGVARSARSRSADGARRGARLAWRPRRGAARALGNAGIARDRDARRRWTSRPSSGPRPGARAAAGHRLRAARRGCREQARGRRRRGRCGGLRARPWSRRRGLAVADVPPRTTRWRHAHLERGRQAAHDHAARGRALRRRRRGCHLGRRERAPTSSGGDRIRRASGCHGPLRRATCAPATAPAAHTRPSPSRTGRAEPSPSRSCVPMGVTRPCR